MRRKKFLFKKFNLILYFILSRLFPHVKLREREASGKDIVLVFMFLWIQIQTSLIIFVKVKFNNKR